MWIAILKQEFPKVIKGRFKQESGGAYSVTAISKCTNKIYFVLRGMKESHTSHLGKLLAYGRGRWADSEIRIMIETISPRILFSEEGEGVGVRRLYTSYMQQRRDK